MQKGKNIKTGVIVVRNPVKNLLRVNALPRETFTGKSATATINIYSAVGQLVQTIRITEADKNTIHIPVERFAVGIYFLHLINAGGINVAVGVYVLRLGGRK